MIDKIMKWAVPLLAGSALAISGSQAFAAQVTLGPVQGNTIYQGSDPTKTDPNFEDIGKGTMIHTMMKMAAPSYTGAALRRRSLNGG